MKKYIKPELRTLELNAEQLMGDDTLSILSNDPDFIDMSNEGVFDDDSIHPTNVWDE